MKLTYRPKGVCSRQIEVALEDGKITSVEILGGCEGNLQGVSKLLVGIDAEDAITRLEGIRCGFKSTSCPDQISKALRMCIDLEKNDLHNITK